MLGGIPEVNAFKWIQQIGKLQVAVNGILKTNRKKSCVKSQGFPDMRELKNKLSHAGQTTDAEWELHDN